MFGLSAVNKNESGEFTFTLVYVCLFVWFSFLLTQVPPSLWLSITAVFAPSSAALRAPARPPDPPPITRKSKRVVSAADARFDAMLRRTSSCLRGVERISFRAVDQVEAFTTAIWLKNIAITRKLFQGNEVGTEWEGQVKASAVSL